MVVCYVSAHEATYRKDVSNCRFTIAHTNFTLKDRHKLRLTYVFRLIKITYATCYCRTLCILDVYLTIHV